MAQSAPVGGCYELTPPIENDEEKNTLAPPIPKVHATRTSKRKSHVTHGPTPLPSPPPVRASSVTKRASTRRKQTAHRKRILAAKPVDEEITIAMDLPEKMQSFLEKEMRWASEAAKSDFLLRLPRPNHKYVTGKGGRMPEDDRFTLPERQEQQTPRIITAGVPSNKPYAPRHQPTTPPVRLAELSLPRDCDFEFTNGLSQEEAFHARPSVKLIIPDVIKAILVDDWENVTKNMQLVPLPHPKPVTKILEDYSAYEMPKRPANSSHADILEETLSGLKEYFDKSLGRILLYKYVLPPIRHQPIQQI